MRLLCLLIFSLLTNVIQAQKSLFPITENELQGFIDATGKIIIAPKFKTIQPFSEGLAASSILAQRRLFPKWDNGYL